MCASEVPANLQGKAIQVEHRLYDGLWQFGDEIIPEKFKMPEGQVEEESKEEEEGKEEEEKQKEEKKEEVEADSK